MTMTSRERVLAALRREQPDRVPYCELNVDPSLAGRLLGWEASSAAFNKESNQFTIEQARAVADRLQTDNLSFVLRAPVYAEKAPGLDGRLYYGDGQIRGEADLERIQLPDPHDDSLYADAERFLKGKGDRATFLVTRLGLLPTTLSMGWEAFSVALYDNRPFLEAVLDRYFDWSEVMVERACQMGFDVLVSTDDLAFNTAPFFSPKVFRDLLLPRIQKVATKITLPWIMHSDGNFLPFIEDMLSLGIAGLHPFEKGAMDIVAMKRDYGDRVCLLGNLDLNILGMGTPEDVDAEARYLIQHVGPGGGYILTSGNTLASYVLPENALAMSAAVRRYGHYPIRVEGS